MLALKKPLFDSGWRNIARKVPAGCVLSLPGLPEGRSQARIPDISGNGNHGTITGCTWYKEPSGLASLSFDGNDVVTLTSNPILAAGQGTIKVWAYMANWADGVQHGLFDSSDATGDNRILLRKEVDNTFLFYIVNGGVAQVLEYSSALSGAGWKMFTLSFALNNTQGYVDTTQSFTDTACTIPTFTTEAAKFGNVVSGANAFWNGRQALALIKNVTTAQSGVTQIFNQEHSLFNV